MTIHHRASTLLFPALLALGAASLAGCPGRLLSPELFVGGGGGDGSAAVCTIGLRNVEAQIITPRCATSTCHDQGSRAGGLDLETANIGARVVGVMGSLNCGRMPLVVRGSTTLGVLVSKVSTDSPVCGSRMPLGLPALSASEIACVRMWAASLGSSVPPDVVTMDTPVVVDVPLADRATDRTRPADVRVDAGSMDAPPPEDVPTPIDTPPPPDVPPPMDIPAPPDVPPPADTGTVDAGVDDLPAE